MAAHHNMDSLISLFHTRLKVIWYPFLYSSDGESNWTQPYLSTISIMKMDSIFPNILGNYLPLWGKYFADEKSSKNWFFKNNAYSQLSGWTRGINNISLQTKWQTRIVTHSLPFQQSKDIILFGHLVYWLLKCDGYLRNEMTFQNPL